MVPLPDAGARTRVRAGRRGLRAAHLLFLCTHTHVSGMAPVAPSTACAHRLATAPGPPRPSPVPEKARPELSADRVTREGFSGVFAG